MSRKPSMTIVGAGRLGHALALALRGAGYRIDEVVSRNTHPSMAKARSLARKLGAQAATVRNARMRADVIWFCVADREIRDAASAVAPLRGSWKGKVALHPSGAMASDELRVLRRRGAAVASLHPLMSFVSGSVPSLAGVTFAVEGDAAAVRLARRIVRDLGGETSVLPKKRKAAYHAWGAFTSPLLVAALVTAEQVARLAGLKAAEARRRMMPIVRQTLNNYATLGPAGAFSGPLIRGDTAVVRRHLSVLRPSPEARQVYMALARVALRHLPVGNRRELKKLLK